MTRRVLLVCTANVCRSPTAERLLQRHMDGLVDVDGERWAVRSAGCAPTGAAMDRHTIAAADAFSIDLAGHTARTLDVETLATDGADLVLTMTRQHLRAVVGVDPKTWRRTFTLKELVRRAAAGSPATEVEGFEGWLRRMAAGRRAAELMMPDPDDDVADPYGRPRRQHDTMVSEVSALVDRLVRVGPWRAVDR